MASNSNAVRKYLYGIDRHEYQALLQKQHGKCAACSEGETLLKPNGFEPRGLCVDHCHTTGKIRGLLCARCNSVIGRVQDSPALLRRLAAYVEVADTGHKVPVADANSVLSELDCVEPSGGV